MKAVQNTGRVGKMGEQKPGVNQVELRSVVDRVPHVYSTKLDVLDALLVRFAPCNIQLGLIDVETDHLPRWRDLARQFQRHVSAAATDVSADMTVTQFQPIEQRHGRGTHDPRQHAKTLAPLDPATDDVVSCGSHHCERRRIVCAPHPLSNIVSLYVYKDRFPQLHVRPRPE
jgi:hypothetical protein